MSSKGQKIKRQFQFDPSEIRRHCIDGRTWHQFVRLREIEIILSLLGDRQFEYALEIGSGDGLQSEKLARRSSRVICSDIDRRRWESRSERNMPSNVSHVIVDAEDLSSFSDNSFDLVYSSNVLEHIVEIDRCLDEIYRVLKPSGIGVHSMPSRHWKVFNSLYRISRLRMPKVHGVERTNLKEYFEFGLSCWSKKLNRAGFKVEDIFGMPFYLGASGRWSSVIVVGNRLRLPSSFTFSYDREKIPNKPTSSRPPKLRHHALIQPRHARSYILRRCVRDRLGASGGSQDSMRALLTKELLGKSGQVAAARTDCDDVAAIDRSHGESGVAQQRFASGCRRHAFAVWFGAGADGDARSPPEQIPPPFEHFRFRAHGFDFQEGERVDPMVRGNPVQSRGAAAHGAV